MTLDRAITLQGELRRDLELTRRDLRRVSSAQADGVSETFPMVACAQLRFRFDGLQYPLRRWVSDAPKRGEAFDAATGCFLYYDPASDTWRREGTDEQIFSRDPITGGCVYIPGRALLQWYMHDLDHPMYNVNVQHPLVSAGTEG